MDDAVPAAEDSLSFLPPPKPTAEEMLGKWIYYRRAGLGHRIQKAFVQAARKGTILELTGAVLPSQYPQYVPWMSVDVVLMETVEEEKANSCPALGRPTKTNVNYPV